MTTRPSVPRGTRSQSPSAKFYSRAFSTRRTSQNGGQGPMDEDMTGDVPQSKRRKLNPGSDTETAAGARLGGSRTPSRRTSQHSASRQRDAGKSKRAEDVGVGATRAPRTSSGNAYTKRASALNLHNYPADHHPVGIAIWVIQKIDSARRERSGSTSSRDSSPGAFLASPSSTGILQASNLNAEFDDGIEPSDRRQAQRERKIKQRLENWAKNKENDVVARAKLDAKKKFGSNPSTQPILLGNDQVEKPSPADEKELYVRRRIRDDFTRLMNRQTKVFADHIAKLEPFQPGFSQKCFPATNISSTSDANLVAAGTLLLDVLPALAEKEVSRTSQLAADALIHALGTGSLSPESFFDAIAFLAKDREILLGSDRVLAQLFSRSSSSGNSKVLRTSSGADSKLFATTNGPFIIYNTIENTEAIIQPSTRHSNISFPTRNSAPARAAPRERRPAGKMTNISEVLTRPQTRASMSPRTSPPKLLKLTRPSKLRGSVSFAKSPSPPAAPKKLELTHDPLSALHPPHAPKAASNPKPTTKNQNLPINQYRSAQGSPPRGASSDQSFPQMEIKDDLVNNLLNLASLASREETDGDSDLDGEENGAPNRAAGIESTLAVVPSLGKSKGKEHLGPLDTCSKAATNENNDTAMLDSMSANSLEQIVNYNYIFAQLPRSEANLSREQVEQVAALYDRLAQGAKFERAKELGLSYPEIPRPFADRDGWKLTGVVNQFGEEIVELDRCTWIYPQGFTVDTQQPLRRLKRKAQLRQECTFGFPPPAGRRNIPHHKKQRLEVEDEENVAYEKVMFDVRTAAQARGLPFQTSLSWEELTESIKAFDVANGIISEQTNTSTIVETVRDDVDDEASSHVEASEISEVDTDDDSDYEPEPRITRNMEETWSGGNGAKTFTFVTVNSPNASGRRLRERPSTSISSTPVSQRRGVDMFTVLDPHHSDMSPPTSTTRYDIRPPLTPGTFNTFNGPITSSNTPTASPIGTPTFMKLNFHPNRKQSSTSPAPSITNIPTRRTSTASISTSSFASRPPSAQPLDIDNANAYNAAKGYTNNNTNNNANNNNNNNSNGGGGGGGTPTSSSSHTPNTADPSSPHGLNGGFPGGGIIINAPEKRSDGRGQRRKSKAPDFKMTVQKAAREGPKVQARAVRGGTVLKFT